MKAPHCASLWLAVWGLGATLLGAGALPAKGLQDGTPGGEEEPSTPAAEESPASPPSDSALAALVRELKERYPDRESVTENYRAIADRLIEFAEEGLLEPEPATESGKALILAAEVLFQGGEGADARALLAAVASQGSRKEDRAQALFLLGSHYFFREKFTATGEGRQSRACASYYWRLLVGRYPDSAWTKRVVSGPLRYIDLLEGKPVPSFRETFEVLTSDPDSDVGESNEHQEPGKEEPAGGQKAATAEEFTLEGLRGKVVVLDFWRSTTPGQQKFETTFSRDLAGMLEEYPELRATVVVLGINLDARRSDFEAAVKAWQMPWPQHHDGLGFETPLVKLFGLPLEPQRMVLEPGGKVVYLGADREEFFQSLSAVLRRAREGKSEEED